MSLWFIALPCVFGAIILLSILACCCCPCSPEKATQRDDEHVVQVLEVVRYPEDGNINSSSTEEARNGAATTVDVVVNSRSGNEPHAAGQRYYYPLQVGDQRPVTAAVAGSTRTRAAEPFVGTVVADADVVATAAVPDASGAVRATRRARDSEGYGEAVYVSHEDESSTPTSQDPKEGHP